MTQYKKLKVPRPVDPRFPISSVFGIRILDKGQEFHRGIDFATPTGTHVYAMADGRVFRSGYENPDNPDQGFGLRIWQESPFDDGMYFLWYAHLSQVLVQEGEMIKKNQIIALTGESGRTFSSSRPGQKAPHLHVQARKKDTNEYYDLAFN